MWSEQEEALNRKKRGQDDIPLDSNDDTLRSKKPTYVLKIEIVLSRT